VSSCIKHHHRRGPVRCPERPCSCPSRSVYFSWDTGSLHSTVKITSGMNIGTKGFDPTCNNVWKTLIAITYIHIHYHSYITFHSSPGYQRYHWLVLNFLNQFQKGLFLWHSCNVRSTQMMCVTPGPSLPRLGISNDLDRHVLYSSSLVSCWHP
jgi:hypothetical protein